MPRLHRLALAAASVTLLVGGAQVAAAQVEITPRVGAYLPLGKLLAETDIASGAPLERRQVGTLLVGLGVGVGLTERIGLQATAAFAPSQVAVTGARTTEDIGAGIVLASLRGIYHLSPRASLLGLHVGTGIGLIERLGGPWREVAGTTDFGLASAIGGRGGLVAGSGIRFMFELEHYMTWVGFRGVEQVPETGGRLHHDVLFTLGMVITVAD